MPSKESLDPVERFGSAIEAKLGLRFDDTRRDVLADVLARRGGARVDDWLARFECDAPIDDVRRLAEELTVGETYFFRNVEQFDALAEVVLPARIAARAHAKTLRVLSAGCSGGEEPYSLAIALRERVPADWTIAITGLDVNPAALRRAAAGRYSTWSLRETPADVRERWFRTRGREFELAAEVRAMVRFAEHNLADDDALLWQPELYDVVFCRNVLMYFAPRHARRVVQRFERSLAQGGYLFLGHAESLRDLTTGFALRQSHGTFYYERAQPSAALPDDRPWHSMVAELPMRAEPVAVPAPVRSDDRRAAARELLGAERYDDALALIDELDPDDPEVLQLRAGAHYLLALNAEREGALANAVVHDEAAADADPGFAMPRLHLGLMARRRRELTTARRELQRALQLLEREDATRLQLFGGGFSREALVALCCAELVACGGPS